MTRNPAEVRASYVIAKARQLIQAAKITRPPTDLRRITTLLEEELNRRIILDWRPLSNDVSGICTENGTTYGILFNKKHHKYRQRFTIAHELGHLALCHRLSKTKHNEVFNLDSKNPTEAEANIFAAEVLMPYSLIKIDIQKGMNVGQLSKRYLVSKEAIGWRLSNNTRLLSI